jgi:uncharacterized oxidoreductase
MNVNGNTVLITGGATGIGLSLAGAFLQAGNAVIICGRRESKLRAAASKFPGLVTRLCDVANPSDREALYNWIRTEHKDLNVLVNNAGIQRAVDLTLGTGDLAEGLEEIETNLVAPINLCAIFTPLLLKRSQAAILNVSSGLGFVPIATMPVYCSTKAAVHSFTVSLRFQLRNTTVKVFEIIPPAVDTELGKGSVYQGEQDYKGIPPAEVSKAIIKAMAADIYEIIVGEAKELVEASRKNPERAFETLNSL